MLADTIISRRSLKIPMFCLVVKELWHFRTAVIDEMWALTISMFYCITVLLHLKMVSSYNSSFAQPAEQDFPICTEMLLTKLLNKVP
jgi:hypothetical protein